MAYSDQNMKFNLPYINGQQIIFTYPQHWNADANDWAITGTDNPLPTGNYIQNASGLWLPQTGENGAADTKITNDEANAVFTKSAEDPIAVLAIYDELSNYLNISPGSSLTVVKNDTKRTKHKELRYGVRFSAATDSRVSVTFFAKADPSFTMGSNEITGQINHNGTLSKINSPFFEVRVHNDSSTDKELRNYIILGVS